MTKPGRALGVGVVLGAAVAAAAWASAQDPAGPRPAPAMPGPPTPMPSVPGAGTVQVPVADLVDPAFRDAVVRVVRQPTLSTRGASGEYVCTPAVYEWLLDHPDRVSLAWRRLRVECVPITDLGGGRFGWADGDGSELTWQTVGKFADGRVWYATGTVKPNAVTPSVPVRAVVVLTHPQRPLGDGTAAVRPVAQAFLQTDSKAANVVMRVLGPTAPKLAEQGAEQLLYFFDGIARYAQKNPDRADALLAPPRR